MMFKFNAKKVGCVGGRRKKKKLNWIINHHRYSFETGTLHLKRQNERGGAQKQEIIRINITALHAREYDRKLPASEKQNGRARLIQKTESSTQPPQLI